MAAHNSYGETRGVRWDPKEKEWILKCDSCVLKRNTKVYWPLSHEFWDKRTMQRCRACELERKRIREKKKRIDDEDYAMRERARRAEYLIRNRDDIRVTRRFYARTYRARQKAKRELELA